MGHGHPHGATGRDAQRRALWIAFVLNGGFLVAEVVGGIVFNSLALLADAAHMATDVAGLGIALFAQRLVDKPASTRHSYGMHRAEALGAQANGVLLLATVAYVVFEALRRIPDPPEVAGAGLLAVASLGLLVNLVSAVLLARARGTSLNLRAAYVHMLADAAGSLGALGAGVAVVVFGFDLADPVVSLLIGLLVLWSAWGLLRDTTLVLMEGTPRGLDPVEVEATIAAQPGVESVHHLHLWELASDVRSLSAHVRLDGEVDLHEAQLRGEQVKLALYQRHNIEHATLELECHGCATPYDGPPAQPPAT
jgi:cobalt-zinc-cadmium efflux system protein